MKIPSLETLINRQVAVENACSSDMDEYHFYATENAAIHDMLGKKTFVKVQQKMIRQIEKDQAAILKASQRHILDLETLKQAIRTQLST